MHMPDAAAEAAPKGTRGLRAVPRPLAGVRVPGLAIAALVLLVFAVLSLAPQLSTYLTTQQQLRDTGAKVAAQERSLKQLDADIARWNDPAYIRSQAGSRLFYVLPGETTYRVVGGAPSAAHATPAPTAKATSTDWTSDLLQSIVTAGTTTSAHPGSGG